MQLLGFSSDAAEHAFWPAWLHRPLITRCGQNGPSTAQSLLAVCPSSRPSPISSCPQDRSDQELLPSTLRKPRGVSALGGRVPLAHYTQSPTSPAQQQKGRGVARDLLGPRRARPLPAPRPALRGGARCGAPGSHHGPLGSACHMLRDEPRAGEQACPAGSWHLGEETDHRGQLPKVEGEAGGAAAGIGLQGHLLALGCGSVRGAGGRNEREGRLLSGGAKMPASQDGPAASGADGRLQVSAALSRTERFSTGSQAVPTFSPGSPCLLRVGRGGMARVQEPHRSAGVYLGSKPKFPRSPGERCWGFLRLLTWGPSTGWGRMGVC